MISEFTSFFAALWSIFEDVTVPILNISFAQLWIGLFVCGLSCSILMPLIGIGGGAAEGISGAAKRGANSIRSKNRAKKRAQYNQSYEKYRSDRKRREEYKKRYKEESL